MYWISTYKLLIYCFFRCCLMYCHILVLFIFKISTNIMKSKFKRLKENGYVELFTSLFIQVKNDYRICCFREKTVFVQIVVLQTPNGRTFNKLDILFTFYLLQFVFSVYSMSSKNLLLCAL